MATMNTENTLQPVLVRGPFRIERFRSVRLGRPIARHPIAIVLAWLLTSGAEPGQDSIMDLL